MKKSFSALYIWPALTALFDFFAFSTAGVISYWLRFNPPVSFIIPIRFDIPPYSNYLALALVSSMFWVIIMAMNGVYAVRWRYDFAQETWEAIRLFIFGFALTFALLFFYRGFSYSRVVALLTLSLVFILLPVSRKLLSFIRAKSTRLRPQHRAFIIGPDASSIANRLENSEDSGLEIVGSLSEDFISEVSLIKSELISKNADTIILTHDLNMFSRCSSLINLLGGMRLNYLYAPPSLGLVTGRLRPVHLAGMPILWLRENPLAGWNGFFKRCFDIIFSSILLILTLPIFVLISMIIKLSSKGPVFYQQQRLGLDGRKINIIKFRSMRVGAEDSSGPVWARKNDNRTTAFGKFLRRWSLDELPQFWNVIRGDMSLVGPRPERPKFVEEFKDQIPRYLERHNVRSGLTGWAQVNGMRGQTPIEIRTQYDIFYVENWSLLFDLKIIAMTVLAVISGKNAY